MTSSSKVQEIKFNYRFFLSTLLRIVMAGILPQISYSRDFLSQAPLSPYMTVFTLLHYHMCCHHVPRSTTTSARNLPSCAQFPGCSGQAHVKWLVQLSDTLFISSILSIKVTYGKYCMLNYISPTNKRYVEVLTPGTPESDFIWKQDIACIVKMRS